MQYNLKYNFETRGLIRIALKITILKAKLVDVTLHCNNALFLHAYLGTGVFSAWLC